MDKTADFLDPSKNVLVSASAGTGKTWTLTTRILRLLLEGAPPDSILAITFTRAAAAEIEQRLMQRMDQWLHLNDTELLEDLQGIRIKKPDIELLQRARNLFEIVQFSEQGLYISTFHAFFQDLLRQFPVEAGVPVDFQIPSTEKAHDILQEAQDRLLAQADRDDSLGEALNVLLRQFRQYSHLRPFLKAFSEKFLEWGCFDRGRSLEEHQEHLRNEIFCLDQKPEGLIPSQEFAGTLSRFADLIEKTGASDVSFQARVAERIRNALIERETESGNFIPQLGKTLLDDGQMKSSLSKLEEALEHRLTPDEIQEYQRLHEHVHITLDYLLLVESCDFNAACYVVVRAFVSHYREIKQNSGYLDYDDLIEATHKLLVKNDPLNDTMAWIQFKLGQRFQHLLLDEFQDTDLLSWRTMQALINAMQETEKWHSVFLVGDVKQSIYQWRRANPKVMAAAEGYLESPHTVTGSLDLSYRSAPIIMQFVNAWHDVLGRDGLEDFQPHKTSRKNLWGRVDLLHAIDSKKEKKKKEKSDEEVPLRDPLTEARNPESGLSDRDRIAAVIADYIQDEIVGKDVIEEHGRHRLARYRDIMILVRRRTHVPQVEHALTQRTIPFARQSRQTLLQHLEISDLLALLHFLLNPADDLSLAQVLRSPLYGATDEDLIEFARADISASRGFDRLRDVAQKQEPTHPFRLAYKQLERWHQKVGHIPPHDLLDQIYHEGDVLERYRTLYSGDRGQQAANNLIRFLELTLELDSGRYPSLTTFIHYIEDMRANRIESADAPDLISTGSEDQEDRVRILTVHAAKGLESPIVLYFEMRKKSRRGEMGSILMDWPTDQARPSYFLFLPRSENRDSASRKFLRQAHEKQEREELNLDYVAFTRAQQHLVLYWHEEEQGIIKPRERLVEALEQCDMQPADHSQYAQSHGPVSVTPSTQTSDDAPQPHKRDTLDRLMAESPAEIPQPDTEELMETDDSPASTWPSRTVLQHASTRGTLIHAVLNMMEDGEPSAGALQQLARKHQVRPDDTELMAWIEEARGLRDDPRLTQIFQPQPGTRIYTEVPVLSQTGDGESRQSRFGRIDRLLILDENIWIIDFKSHRIEGSADLQREAARYQPQMRRYAGHLRRIYPTHKIRCSLLFTTDRLLHDLPVG